MGLAYNTYLSSNKIYGCKHCKAHLANADDIISRVSLIFTYRLGGMDMWLGPLHLPARSHPFPVSSCISTPRQIHICILEK